MTIRMKKTGIFLLGCLLAISLLLCGVLPLFEAHAKDGALTENEPFPAGFLEGTAELTVSYSAGKGFALNGKEFTSLYEGSVRSYCRAMRISRCTYLRAAERLRGWRSPP